MKDIRWDVFLYLRQNLRKMVRYLRVLNGFVPFSF